MADQQDNTVSDQQQDDPYDLSHLSGQAPAAPSAAEPPADAAPGTQPPESAPAAPEPARDPHIVALARDLGFTEADLATVDAGSLPAVVAHAARLQAQQQREAIEHFHKQQQAAPAKTAEPAPEEDDGLADVHPAIRTQFKKLKEAHQKELAEVKTKLAEREKADERARARYVNDAVDAAFSALPAMEHVFGKGSLAGLKDDAAKKRRVAIYRQAGVSADDSPLAIQQKIKAAADDVYAGLLPAAAAPAQAAAPAPEKAAGYDGGDAVPPPSEEAARKAGKPSAADLAEAALVKPTGRKAPPRQGDAAAVEAIRAWKQKNGFKPTLDEPPAELQGVE